MGFGTDFTEAEQAQLAEIEDVFDRLFPANSTDTESGTSVAVLRTFYVQTPNAERNPGSQWHAVMREVNAEAVVRLGQNFRNTKTVMNRLLKWRTIFSVSERAASVGAFGGDGGRVLGQAWMKGLVYYFKERLERCFEELNVRHAEDACIAPRGGHPAPGTRPAAVMDGEQLVTRCISGARAIVNPQMSSSPYFIQAVRTCREMVQALQVVQGLIQIFSSHFQNGGGGINGGGMRRANTADLSATDDHLTVLRTPQWLFRFIFLFLGAMDLLQDQHRDTAALSGSQLDYAIHCIACLVGEVDGKRKDSDVKATLDALVLGHVKNACLSEFPPQRTLAMLEDASTGRNVNEEGSEADGILTRYGPLLQQLLVHYPDFMTVMTSFARRNGVEDWGVSVMLAALFCWDTTTPPLPTQVQVGAVRYCVPTTVASSGYPVDEFVSTVVYHLTRAALRPLLSEILSPSHAAAAAGTAATTPAVTDGAGAEQAAAGGTGSSLLSPAEQKVCALLLGVVAWLDSVTFPECARMTRWSALDVGTQVMRPFNLGRWCMGRVLRGVLEDVIAVALQSIEAEARKAPVAAEAEEDPLAAVPTPLLQYLLRVERLWNALTEHTIELDSAAMDHLRAMGAKVLPKATTTADFSAVDGGRGPAARTRYDTSLLAEYRHEFYEAVQSSMKARWPKAYADLLTDPLLHSIHVRLVHAESATQRGVGPRPAGAAVGPRGGPPVAPGATGGRGAPVKRPPPRPNDAAPPPPEAVVLATKEDLHSALRLVLCIKNRDHFIHLYTATVRERLLSRPAPDVIADADLEKNKKSCEQEVEQFLATCLNDTNLLKTVRELHSNYTPQTLAFSELPASSQNPSWAPAAEAGRRRDFKLATTVLDWRLWGDEAALAAAKSDDPAAAAAELPPTVAEMQVAVTQAASTATAPLPFPVDALPYLQEVEQRYLKDHNARTLRWDWHSHVFTTFTLMYPKENGRVTTVSGTLLLQRLFLAIAAHGRAGVELGTLAQRAGLDERRVLAVLRPCLDRDRLLVRVGEESSGTAPPPIQPSTRLALNYAFTRPPNRPRGDFTYWPSQDRRRPAVRGADQDATMNKRREIIKTSIMQVMKQVQSIHHDELYAVVREKNAKRFEVTVRNFKQGIEDLIGKDFMARAENNQNEYVFRA